MARKKSWIYLWKIYKFRQLKVHGAKHFQVALALWTASSWQFDMVQTTGYVNSLNQGDYEIAGDLLVRSS